MFLGVVVQLDHATTERISWQIKEKKCIHFLYFCCPLHPIRQYHVALLPLSLLFAFVVSEMKKYERQEVQMH